jgi:hypothetical protein
MSARRILPLLAFGLLSIAIAAVPAVRAEGAEETDPAKKVLGLSYRGHHRAYPLEIFFPPRVVNDDIREQEVVIFHDPARGISSAFFRMVMGEAIQFSGSVQGTVADDLTTITRWDLGSGKAVGGNLTGMELIPLPVVNISLEEWLARHPDTDIYLRDLP